MATGNSQLQFTRSALTLALGHLLALAALGTAGWIARGAVGASAALIAVILCATAGVAGRWVGSRFSGPGMIHHRMLLGALPRLGIPLWFCLVVYGVGVGPLEDAGLIYYVLAAFAVSLALETYLAIAEVEATSGGNN